ncbi:hypothetical protein KIW84_024143 [Lathyrus oleraceus]|uniref:Retrovirus-related Pol polyprotein from transposon TNT 1-94 n=1 Tax=Pisum sativum TaxID=3888 RepID=A0A9D4YHB0_PEA|nr:hypothetical protein KIW84_024143 [Pisum sativum]
MDPIPPLENYRKDEIKDIGDAENEPPIINGPNQEVTDGNRNDGDNEDMVEDYEDEEQVPQVRRGTSKTSLCFGSRKPELISYTDADMAGDIDSMKSTSGFLITYSGGAVSWQSKLQKCVALSTTEAEFIATT